MSGDGLAVHPHQEYCFEAGVAQARVHAKGVVLCERACFCLLSASITPPLLRTLLRTSVSIETLTRRLLRTLLRSAYW